MNSTSLRSTAVAVAALAALLAGGAARANDFPTADRVLYVEDCIRANPGPYFEMVNKCSCAVDAIAAEVKYDEYATMQTISNGMTIGGERGGAIRDVPTLQPELKKYRELQAKVKKSCFINDPK
ncbi:MAG TPA: hypothetical protein VNU71_12045 [Burkholderiaceae bacterium]|nr:hypothetical protein [Burkholderiaceae bacterium]